MKQDYSIDGLIETFKRHNDVHEANDKEMRRKVESGEWEKQDWMDDNFSISLALHHICLEVKKLREAQMLKEDNLLRHFLLLTESKADESVKGKEST